MGVIVMSRKYFFGASSRRKSRVFLTGLFALTVGCMDVSPATTAVRLDNELLHSIRFPFKRGLFAVGDTISINPKGVLITKDTVVLDQSQIRFRVSPLSSNVQVDSLGVLYVQGYTSGRITLYADYTLGDITRTDTAYIYVSNEKYDVSHIEILALDSAKGGRLTILAEKRPKYGIKAYTVEGLSINEIDFINALFVTLVDSAASSTLRVTHPLEATVSPGVYTKLTGDHNYGTQWIKVEGVLYGKYVRDSAAFTALRPAEVAPQLQISPEYTLYFDNDLYLTPCGYLTLWNPYPFDLHIELSRDVDLVHCSENSSSSRTLTVPASSTSYIQIGLPVSDTVSWSVTRIVPDLGLSPAINSRIHIINPLPLQYDTK